MDGTNRMMHYGLGDRDGYSSWRSRPGSSHPPHLSTVFVTNNDPVRDIGPRDFQDIQGTIITPRVAASQGVQELIFPAPQTGGAFPAAVGVPTRLSLPPPAGPPVVYHSGVWHKEPLEPVPLPTQVPVQAVPGYMLRDAGKRDKHWKSWLILALVILALVFIAAIVFILVELDDDDDDDDDHHDDHHEEVHWGYSGEYGPEHWGDIEGYEMCKYGEHQSPINIMTGEAHYDTSLTPISLMTGDGDGYTFDELHMENSGHSVSISVGTSLYISGGGFEDHAYKVASFHFHWGSENYKGSEHKIDNMACPLEMHIVCYNHKKYGNFDDAVDKADGLAVLGVLFMVGEKDHPQLKMITSELEYLHEGDSKVKLEGLRVSWLLPSDRELYYRYKGSLTTPGCYESVTWTVFKSTVEIPEHQLEKFRELKQAHGEPIVDNFRPVQPLHDRKVMRSYETSGSHNGYRGRRRR